MEKKLEKILVALEKADWSFQREPSDIPSEQPDYFYYAANILGNIPAELTEGSEGVYIILNRGKSVQEGYIQIKELPRIKKLYERLDKKRWAEDRKAQIIKERQEKKEATKIEKRGYIGNLNKLNLK